MSHLVRVRRVRGCVAVEVSGEVDAFVAPELERMLEDAGELPVVCDLENVSFLDSTALGVVVRSYKEAAESRRGFAVIAPKGRASNILRLTALDKGLPIEKTRAAAIARLESRANGDPS